jgi:streptomycin 3"-adenylyltransferase
VTADEIQAQVEAASRGLTNVLGSNLAGLYLHGSAVLGCFGPRSDIDLVAVLARPTSVASRRRLAELLLGLSAPYEPPGPTRPIELDAVLEESLRPWRYPNALDFHYSEEYRERLRDGSLEAWEGLESRNLAAHLTVLRQAGIALTGPPITETFPEVPWPDYVDALTHDLKWCRTRFAEIPRYGVLSVARIWATLATRAPQSKATGAEWALPRLPGDLRAVLEHSLALYRGHEEVERWGELPVAAYVEAVAHEIEPLVTHPQS